MADLTLTSTLISSPTPTPSPPSRPSLFHVPGPSSRYHSRSRLNHTRFQSTTSHTVPIAPILSTEKRSTHRRAHTTTTVPHNTLASPSPSSVSEVSRSPLSRFSSYTSSTMAAILAPSTPAKHVLDPAAMMHDSPFSAFSDYFSNSEAPAYNEPSSETQKLVLRLNKLQALLMREEEHEAINIVGRKMSEIDNELNALHSQTRLGLEDSGLFMDEEEMELHATQSHSTPTFEGASGAAALSQDYDVPSPEERRAEHDFLLLEAQRVLDSVTQINTSLRARLAELASARSAHLEHLSEQETEIARLRSENETLKSDLVFDHSELLFLDLQHQTLQVEIDEIDSDESDERIQLAGQEGRDGIKRVRRGRILEKMERWREDFRDVETRFTRRRGRYGILSASTMRRRDSGVENGGSGEDVVVEGEGSWRLETVKQAMGRRVSSITIRRLESPASNQPLTLDVEEQDADGQINHDAAELKAATHSPADSAYVEDQNNTIHRNYADNSTQTDDSIPAESELEEEDEEDDCAITTSAPTPAQPASPTIQPLGKSAWQELWQGLADFAGTDKY